MTATANRGDAESAKNDNSDGNDERQRPMSVGLEAPTAARERADRLTATTTATAQAGHGPASPYDNGSRQRHYGNFI